MLKLSVPFSGVKETSNSVALNLLFSWQVEREVDVSSRMAEVTGRRASSNAEINNFIVGAMLSEREVRVRFEALFRFEVSEGMCRECAAPVNESVGLQCERAQLAAPVAFASEYAPFVPTGRSSDRLKKRVSWSVVWW